MKDGRIYIFSPFLRLFHWLMAISIFLLFATGLYIGDPFYVGTVGLEPTYGIVRVFSMENIRFIHFAAAYTLVGAFILRIYGFAIHKGDRLLPKVWTRSFWIGFKDVMLHYSMLRYSHRSYLRNSLARTSYAGLYTLVLLEAITGFAMYGMIHPNSLTATLFAPVTTILGNEYNVHLIHHLLAWAIMLFVIGHVYMVFRADIMEGEGEASSMISGYKYLKEKPDDLGDLK